MYYLFLRKQWMSSFPTNRIQHCTYYFTAYESSFDSWIKYWISVRPVPSYLFYVSIHDYYSKWFACVSDFSAKLSRITLTFDCLIICSYAHIRLTNYSRLRWTDHRSLRPIYVLFLCPPLCFFPPYRFRIIFFSTKTKKKQNYIIHYNFRYGLKCWKVGEKKVILLEK